MLQRALHNWNFFRIVRLVLGVMIIVQSIQFREYWFVLVGIVFAAMAIFDMGCAGGACAAPPIKRSNQTDPNATEKNTIVYEEVGN
jgi:hypothetical protein